MGTSKLSICHLQTSRRWIKSYTKGNILICASDVMNFVRTDERRLSSDTCVRYRTLLRLPDGGTLGVDTCPPSNVSQDLPKDTPIVIVQHGLSGGSHEPYVRSILAGACAPKSKGGLGYRGIVINFRGCQFDGRFVFPRETCVLN